MSFFRSLSDSALLLSKNLHPLQSNFSSSRQFGSIPVHFPHSARVLSTSSPSVPTTHGGLGGSNPYSTATAPTNSISMSDSSCKCVVREYGSLEVSKSATTVSDPFMGVYSSTSISTATLTKFSKPRSIDYRKSKVKTLLEENGIKSIKENMPLFHAEDVVKAFKLFQKNSIVIHGLSLWKKEGDVFFEVYWRKGLDLDDAIRELHYAKDVEGLANDSHETSSYTVQKCTQFVKKLSKDATEEKIEYFGIKIVEDLA